MDVMTHSRRNPMRSKRRGFMKAESPSAPSDGAPVHSREI